MGVDVQKMTWYSPREDMSVLGESLDKFIDSTSNGDKKGQVVTILLPCCYIYTGTLWPSGGENSKHRFYLDRGEVLGKV